MLTNLFANKRNILILKFILAAFILTPTLHSYCQSINSDSLKALLNQTSNNEERYKITAQLSEALLSTEPLQALEYGEEAAHLAADLKHDSLLNNANLNLATVYFQLENFPKALQLCYTVIQTLQKDPDANQLFTAYNNLGIIYQLQGDYKNAILNFNKALTYLSPKTEAYISRKAGVFNNLGGTYKQLSEFDKATSYLKEALKLSKQINDKDNTARILSNQGQINQHLGRYDLALSNYLEAMEIRKKLNYKAGIASSYYRLGTLYFDNNNTQAAELHLKKAVDMAQKAGPLQIVSYSSDLLYTLYKQQGKFKEAFQALKLHQQANDSLFNEKRTRKIAQLEMQFQFDLKQKEFTATQHEKDLYYLLGGVTLGLSLIIITLLFFLQRNKARKSELEQTHLLFETKNLEKDIEIKDKELTTNILYLIQKNELIDNISEKLLEIKQSVATESQPGIQKVVTDLRSTLQPELLQEFEHSFQQVHEEFYAILNERFPNLSPSERRLCAFLKLNMTTKEISAITHQTTKTLEIARTRLRKKLKLTGTDQNLVTFLSQLQ
ncbi:hypothetical protein C3K47_04205 [Solitalea longa]|uniref:HTH luxR-type domain-containing protein n=1 Tax=Solitalea longa TaxID=2079460 RepID=A0A2S5A7S9_9SPHI|nr:tetratricopeptide repeat protein [Solitalea longa]POY38605.1 hypothetical protein C3K47_04205 [Solitalea longa]